MSRPRGRGHFQDSLSLLAVLFLMLTFWLLFLLVCVALWVFVFVVRRVVFVGWFSHLVASFFSCYDVTLSLCLFGSRDKS